jgi:hypothetical protein
MQFLGLGLELDLIGLTNPNIHEQLYVKVNVAYCNTQLGQRDDQERKAYAFSTTTRTRFIFAYRQSIVYINRKDILDSQRINHPSDDGQRDESRPNRGKCKSGGNVCLLINRCTKMKPGMDRNLLWQGRNNTRGRRVLTNGVVWQCATLEK